MVSQSSDLNTPVLHLDSPSSWCTSRNQEFSPVIPTNNSPVRADSAATSRASPTIYTPKPRSRQPVNCLVECQNLAFGSQFFEDILWPPAVNHLPVEADSAAGSSTGNVYALLGTWCGNASYVMKFDVEILVITFLSSCDESSITTQYMFQAKPTQKDEIKETVCFLWQVSILLNLLKNLLGFATSPKCSIPSNICSQPTIVLQS